MQTLAHHSHTFSTATHLTTRRRVWAAAKPACDKQPGLVNLWTNSSNSSTVQHCRCTSVCRSSLPNSPGAISAIATQATRPVDDFATDKRPVILYDGVCNLCNGAVNFMLDHDKAGQFRMAALQSPAGMRLLQRCGRRRDDISSIVLVEANGRHSIRSEAVLRIAQRLTNPFPLLALFGLPVPPLLRDWVYDQVANNRYSILGRRDVCRLSTAGFEDRFIVE